jgi:Cryptococcal mannosyltransferase 1
MWPYFISSASRGALTANLPVPVKSCWNGVVAFKAEPFYASPPLRFRAVPDSLAKRHLEGSECCFIHADGYRANHQGVWLNPNVRVGYNLTTYEAVNPETRDGRVWPPWREKVKGMWQNRMTRWLGWLKRASEWHRVKNRVRTWEAEKVMDGRKPNREPALHCLINEMQVLVENGWMHV